MSSSPESEEEHDEEESKYLDEDLDGGSFGSGPSGARHGREAMTLVLLGDRKEGWNTGIS